MKKLLLLLLLSSCRPTLPVVTPNPEPISPGVISIGTITGATEAEKLVVNSAFNDLKQVIYSPAFKTEVLSSKFTSTNDKTNQQILDLFIKSKITINVDIFSGTYIQNHVYHTEGYENGDGFVHVNRYFIYEPLPMSSLMLHETAHKLGFSHVSASDSTSVPYSMNRICDSVESKLNLAK